MTLEHHSLAKEFPELRETMHRLQISNPKFRASLDKYHELDMRIYRIELRIEPVSDDRCAQLKRRRVYLKDLLVQMMREARAETT